MGLKPPRSLQRGLCPRVTAGALHLAYLSAIVASNGGEELDLRVSKAMHMRGYGKVRISVVDHGSADYRGFFDYEAPFAHRWTGLHLHSVVEKVPSNGTAVFDIGGRRVEVRLPAEGHRSRGLLFADPCIISSRDWNCTTADRFRTFDRLVDVVNTVVGSNEIDYWGILGDNFYESRSPIGQIFFSQSEAILVGTGKSRLLDLGTAPRQTMGPIWQWIYAVLWPRHRGCFAQWWCHAL